MSKIYLIWHKNPDTDAILAPIVYAEYLKHQWYDAEAIKIGPANNESLFILNYVWIPKPRRVDKLPAGSQIYLLDHSEKAQTIQNIDELEVIGLVDHHNFGWLTTSKPIFARVEPLACTMSVMYKIFKENNYLPTQKMAILMVSAIISDTLYFRSPTTTEEDKVILEELNQIAKIEDIEKYSLEVFNAKSDLWDISTEEVVMKDFKIYDVSDSRMAIGVMETTNPNYAMTRKDEILKILGEIKAREELDFILFSVVDILNQKNIGMVLGENESNILQKALEVKTDDNNIADLGSRLSRKKELVPPLTEYFKSIKQ